MSNLIAKLSGVIFILSAGGSLIPDIATKMDTFGLPLPTLCLMALGTGANAYYINQLSSNSTTIKGNNNSQNSQSAIGSGNKQNINS